MAGVVSATVRDGDDEWHIECRFDDGQKYAAIRVDKEQEDLADAICAFLNARARGTSAQDGRRTWPTATNTDP
jgi:hypothetical protein